MGHTMSEWILLHNTVVRIADVCRIDMISTSSCIDFKIILRYGDPLRISIDQVGGDWCLKKMEDGKATAKSASKELDGNESLAESEFSE
jgi:hypothetical protein